MFCFLQYARGNPVDWEGVNLTTDGDIRDLPKRDKPEIGVDGTTEVVIAGVGTRTVLDEAHADADLPGWIYDFSCQGTTFGRFDWLHLDMDGAALIVTTVMDDLEDYLGVRHARQYRIGLMQVDNSGKTSTPRLQPNITRVAAWGEDVAHRDRFTAQQFGTVDTFASFSPPGPENKRRYGIWQTDSNVLEQELAKTTNRGYPEWIVATP